MYSSHLTMVCVISGLFIPFSLTGSLLIFLQIRIILIFTQIISRRVRHRPIDKMYFLFLPGTSNNCLSPLWSQIEAGDSKNKGLSLSLALIATDFEVCVQGFSHLTMDLCSGITVHLFHREQENRFYRVGSNNDKHGEYSNVRNWDRCQSG